MTVLLTDGSVLTVTTDMTEAAIIGTVVTGTVQNENGVPTERSGVAIEVLSAE